MSWLTKWFINNPVGANLLMLAIIASGVMAFGQLRVESFPQIAPSSVVINVAYREVQLNRLMRVLHSELKSPSVAFPVLNR